MARMSHKCLPALSRMNPSNISVIPHQTTLEVKFLEPASYEKTHRSTYSNTVSLTLVSIRERRTVVRFYENLKAHQEVG